MSGEPKQEILPPGDRLELFEQALEVERERIRSQDKRTDVVRAAIDANDASDKRQFEFHMAKLAADRERHADNAKIEERKLKIAAIIAAAFGLVSRGLLGAFCYVLFWGTAEQSDVAIRILTTLGTGVGGFGVIYAVITAFRALLTKR